MAQKQTFSPTEPRTAAYDQTGRKSTDQITSKSFAHDREAQRLEREERHEAVIVLLFPTLFAEQMEAA